MAVEGENYRIGLSEGDAQDGPAFAGLPESLYDGRVSRQRALKLITAALVGGGLLAALPPRMAEASTAGPSGPTAPAAPLGGGATGGGNPGGGGIGGGEDNPPAPGGGGNDGGGSNDGGGGSGDASFERQVKRLDRQLARGNLTARQYRKELRKLIRNG